MVHSHLHYLCLPGKCSPVSVKWAQLVLAACWGAFPLGSGGWVWEVLLYLFLQLIRYPFLCFLTDLVGQLAPTWCGLLASLLWWDTTNGNEEDKITDFCKRTNTPLPCGRPHTYSPAGFSARGSQAAPQPAAQSLLHCTLLSSSTFSFLLSHTDLHLPWCLWESILHGAKSADF